MIDQLIQAEAALQKALERKISHGEISLTLVLRDEKIVRFVIQTTESTLISKSNTSADVNTGFCN